MNQPIPPKLGKYEVIAPLGSGAQATVYRARQPGLEREVAIKVVALGGATASDFLARFEQEAQVAARLEHPNILPVHDYGEQDGFAYFVMRLVRNGTLAQRMASGRVPDEEALVILEQIARALDHAHARQVIHRDVKPANILLSEGGQALLADFGISKLLEGSSLQSLTGSVPCTPAYSSPDPLAGEAPDGRSDQYSLAVIAYEMLSGRRPFDSGTPLDVMRDHAFKSPPFHHPWFAARPTVVEVLGRALAKQRDQRFDSCVEFVTALREALRVPLASSADIETGERHSELTGSPTRPPLTGLLQSSVPPPLPARASDEPEAIEPPPIEAALLGPEAREGASAPKVTRRSPARLWALATLGAALLVAGIGFAGNRLAAGGKPGSKDVPAPNESTTRGSERQTPPPWTAFPLTITVDDSIRGAVAADGLSAAISQDVVPALQRELRSSGLLEGEALYDPSAAPEVRGRSLPTPAQPTELSDRAFVVLSISWKYGEWPESSEPRMVSIDGKPLSVRLSATLVFGGEERPLGSANYLQAPELPPTLSGAAAPTVRKHAPEFAKMLAASTDRELRSILEFGVRRTLVIVGPAGTECDLRALLSGLDGLLDVQRVTDGRVRPSQETVTLEPLDGPGAPAFPVPATATVEVWSVRYKAPTASTLEALRERLREHLADQAEHIEVRHGIGADAYVLQQNPKH